MIRHRPPLPAAHTRHHALCRRFRRTLATATQERSRRRGVRELPDGGTEFAWVAYERTVMCEQVNRARAELGWPAVDIDAVARAESHAVGHVDYVDKFALHCANLAMTRDLPVST